jgi:hypothetical protein
MEAKIIKDVIEIAHRKTDTAYFLPPEDVRVAFSPDCCYRETDEFWWAIQAASTVR